MGYDLPKIPTNPRCSDHPTKSGRADLYGPEITNFDLV